MENNNRFIQRAISLSEQGMQEGAGGPFGAVIVRDGNIIAEAYNQVTSTTDPTAHAEVMAIRAACKKLNTFQLEDCVLYTSCEPCPMCLGAIYWARLKKVYYAANHSDAAFIDFDDQFIYEELDKPMTERKIPFEQLSQEKAVAVFEKWSKKTDKIAY